MAEQVEVSEVKRHFLLASSGKELFGRNLSESQLKENYEVLKEKIDSMPEGDLDSKINYQRRVDNYNSLHWYKGTKNLEDMGNWPGMRGISVALTMDSVVKTAERIKGIEHISPMFLEKDAARLLNEIKSIHNKLGFILPNFPIIIYPGGMIRERFNEVHRKPDEPLCEILDYDIDEGNCRAVAYAIAGLREVPAYFGVESN